MDIKPQKPDITAEDISVVLVGEFNPSIFHPMWFAHQGLIREAEAADAKVELVHSDVSSFSIEWLTVQVLRERFTATIKADVFRQHLNDFVQGTFQKLAHTPARQMGINHSSRIHFKSEDDWHGFGHFIAPKSPWSNVLTRPGLRSFHMQATRNFQVGGKSVEKPGHLLISIDADLSSRGTALFRVNDHYDHPAAAGEPPKAGAVWAVELLNEIYIASLDNSKNMTAQMLDKFVATTSVDGG